MVPIDAQVIARCTVKVLVLYSSVDKPEFWDNKRINEQAANVKPCSLLLLYQSDSVRLHIEDKAQGKVYHHFIYNQVDYRIHSKTWHTLRLSDDRCFGLVFLEDELLTNFLKAFALICSQVNKVWENPDTKYQQDREVQSHALPIPSRANLKKLALDLPILSGATSHSPTSPHIVSPGQSPATTPRGYQCPQMQRVQGGIGDLVQRLQDAIARGDTNLAKQISETLALQRTSLSIDVPTERPLANRPEEILIKICVEDRSSTGTEFQLKVPTNMKIIELKKKMLLDYGFAPEVQKWIIGKRLAKDNENLQQCGATRTGSTIYLYLVSRKSIGFSEEEYQRKYGHLFPRVSEKALRQMGTSPEVTRPVYTPTKRLESPLVDPKVERELQISILEGNPIEETTPPAIHTPAPAPVPKAVRVSPLSKEGWSCRACTYVNLWTRNICSMCDAARPEDLHPPPDYIIPRKEKERLEQVEREERDLRLSEQTDHVSAAEREAHYESLVSADRTQDLIPNTEEFMCAVCMDDVAEGDGVVLRDCLHSYCRECLKSLVETCDTGEAKCPYIGNDFTCDSTLQHREVKALVDEDAYQTFLQRSVQIAESRADNSYHCKTPDCHGWCLYEDKINMWRCGLCEKPNCLTCKAIHEGVTCRQYQKRMELLAATDQEAKETRAIIERMLVSGEAMRCPSCDVIIQKKEGCDWVQCSMCFTEICWVTKGPRWGKNGLGDISGGCHCLEDGETRCAPNCVNCH